jgi:hypothetical protein
MCTICFSLTFWKQFRSRISKNLLPTGSPFREITVQEEPVPIPVFPGQDVTVYPDPTDPRVSLTFEEITTPRTLAMTKTPELHQAYLHFQA